MYDRNKIYEQAKEVTVKNKLFFIEDIVAFLPISKPTFYEFFPIESNEINELKRLLEINRTELKVGLRSKWYKSNAPALQMALMKLICTDEERKMLSMTYTENESNVKVKVDPYSELTDEQLRSEIERLSNK